MPLAGAYILSPSPGGSVETLSGFERALKPVWLEQMQPQLVFVGSSRVRDGFDPALIDPALKTRSFNYGASSMTPYEARRFVQDALAQPSVKQIVVALDAFTGDGGPGEALPSFDETRLAVTPDGKPTPRRGLWLFTTRYLSGGALGMNALSAWSLLQLKPGQTAADRPDIFGAYGHMNEAVMKRDLNYRRARAMRMGDGADREFSTMLAAACDSRRADPVLSAGQYGDHGALPPKRCGRAGRLQADGARGRGPAQRRLHQQGGAVRLHGAERADHAKTLKNGLSPDYVDLVHFRPPAGLWLLRQMGVTRSQLVVRTRSRSWWGSWWRVHSALLLLATATTTPAVTTRTRRRRSAADCGDDAGLADAGRLARRKRHVRSAARAWDPAIAPPPPRTHDRRPEIRHPFPWIRPPAV